MSVLSSNFKHEGRIFHIMGTEYVMICLKIYLFGPRVINECSDDERSVGMFSLGKFTDIRWVVA